MSRSSLISAACSALRSMNGTRGYSTLPSVVQVHEYATAVKPKGPAAALASLANAAKVLGSSIAQFEKTVSDYKHPQSQPKKPKRTVSPGPYALFIKEQFSKTDAKGKGVASSKMKEFAELWKTLSVDKKDVYVKQAAALKAGQ